MREVLSGDAAKLTSKLGAADRIIAVSHPALEHYHPEAHLIVIAGIIQQIYFRYRQGHSQDPRFAGLIDVAKREPFNLPHRPNGLAYTLCYYGVGPGPYLVLPLIGATTLRDVFGRVVDLSILPAVAGPPLNDPAVALGRGVISSIDDRARSDELIVRLRDESPDPYATMRDYYLQKRQAEIDVLRGKRDNADISIDAILAPYLNGGQDMVPAEPPVVGSDTAPGTDAPVSGEAEPVPAA